MYFTTYQTTYAVDAVTGQVKWRSSHPVNTAGEGSHRGVAYADGMVFRGFNDGHFVAMKVTDGSVVWEKVVADPAKGESLPMAPLAWDGKVFVGQRGKRILWRDWTDLRSGYQDRRTDLDVPRCSRQRAGGRDLDQQVEYQSADWRRAMDHVFARPCQWRALRGNGQSRA